MTQTHTQTQSPRSKAAMEPVKVFVRMRGLNEYEKRNVRFPGGRSWAVESPNSITQPMNELGVSLPKREGKTFFTFNGVFDETIPTTNVYNESSKELVQDFVNGISGNIITYGQTSAGKTFTMQGQDSIKNGSSAGNGGIIQMAAIDIFTHLAKHPNDLFLLRLSAIEVYNEEIRDLLASDVTDVPTRYDSKLGLFVDATEEFPMNYNDLIQIFSRADKKRNVRSTGMNERSSRSHTMFRIILEKKKIDDMKGSIDLSEIEEDGDPIQISTLNLIDLAGSDTILRFQRLDDETTKEGQQINKSLFALSRVFEDLSKAPKTSHINYRDSNLTRILQPYLTGNLKFVILCCVTPSTIYAEQTRKTLEFGTFAKGVSTRATVKRVLDERSFIIKTLREVNSARSMAAIYGDIYDEKLKKAEMKWSHIEGSVIMGGTMYMGMSSASVEVIEEKTDSSQSTISTKSEQDADSAESRVSADESNLKSDMSAESLDSRKQDTILQRNDEKEFPSEILTIDDISDHMSDESSLVEAKLATISDESVPVEPSDEEGSVCTDDMSSVSEGANTALHANEGVASTLSGQDEGTAGVGDANEINKHVVNNQSQTPNGIDEYPGVTDSIDLSPSIEAVSTCSTSDNELMVNPPRDDMIEEVWSEFMKQEEEARIQGSVNYTNRQQDVECATSGDEEGADSASNHSARSIGATNTCSTVEDEVTVSLPKEESTTKYNEQVDLLISTENKSCVEDSAIREKRDENPERMLQNEIVAACENMLDDEADENISFVLSYDYSEDSEMEDGKKTSKEDIVNEDVTNYDCDVMNEDNKQHNEEENVNFPQETETPLIAQDSENVMKIPDPALHRSASPASSEGSESRAITPFATLCRSVSPASSEGSESRAITPFATLRSDSPALSEGSESRSLTPFSTTNISLAPSEADAEDFRSVSRTDLSLQDETINEIVGDRDTSPTPSDESVYRSMTPFSEYNISPSSSESGSVSCYSSTMQNEQEQEQGQQQDLRSSGRNLHHGKNIEILEAKLKKLSLENGLLMSQLQRVYDNREEYRETDDDDDNTKTSEIKVLEQENRLLRKQLTDTTVQLKVLADTVAQLPAVSTPRHSDKQANTKDEDGCAKEAILDSTYQKQIADETLSSNTGIKLADVEGKTVKFALQRKEMPAPCDGVTTKPGEAMKPTFTTEPEERGVIYQDQITPSTKNQSEKESRNYLEDAVVMNTSACEFRGKISTKVQQHNEEEKSGIILKGAPNLAQPNERDDESKSSQEAVLISDSPSTGQDAENLDFSAEEVNTEDSLEEEESALHMDKPPGSDEGDHRTLKPRNHEEVPINQMLNRNEERDDHAVMPPQMEMEESCFDLKQAESQRGGDGKEKNYQTEDVSTSDIPNKNGEKENADAKKKLHENKGETQNLSIACTGEEDSHQQIRSGKRLSCTKEHEEILRNWENISKTFRFYREYQHEREG